MPGRRRRPGAAGLASGRPGDDQIAVEVAAAGSGTPPGPAARGSKPGSRVDRHEMRGV